MTACIFYHPEAYSTAGPRLMGRHAAGESFLRGLLLYGRQNHFWVQVRKAEHAEAFRDTVARVRPGAAVSVIDGWQPRLLRMVGTVFHPAPTLGEPAFQRALLGGAASHRAWSLCGITHTTASATAMEAITRLVTAPVQPWDALICTSTAVKENVIRLLEAEAAYLQHRLGITRVVQPKLPVIPLGVHTADFALTAAQRDAARKSLGIGPDTVAVLFLGRLSFHAKAHPLAMYRALELARAQTKQKVALIECGWHPNEVIAEDFAAAARQACPSVRVMTLDGRNASARHTAWAAADIFCSLADNIQETFGITPVEAMAAGLPVVVSDWDGYRDTVRDGTDGFRVPTAMPAAGLARDLATRHAIDGNFDMYCGAASNFVAVDIDAAAKALAQLLASPELRHRMGKAGRDRARADYDWAAIIPRYEALWDELAERRRSEGDASSAPPHPWPARADPFHLFAGYPTRTVDENSVLALADVDAASALLRLGQYRLLLMVQYAAAVLPTEAEVEAIILRAEAGPRRAGAFLAGVPDARRTAVLRGLAWLLKLGILRLLD